MKNLLLEKVEYQTEKMITSMNTTLKAAKQELTTVFEELEKQKDSFKN